MRNNSRSCWSIDHIIDPPDITPFPCWHALRHRQKNPPLLRTPCQPCFGTILHTSNNMPVKCSQNTLPLRHRQKTCWTCLKDNFTPIFQRLEMGYWNMRSYQNMMIFANVLFYLTFSLCQYIINQGWHSHPGIIKSTIDCNVCLMTSNFILLLVY